ncbi:MAG: bifunctional phosphopantothenoylcysteine decarboxylase/phosphopantothenate--cysteine ligase CoaBC [Chromatiales bacterium]|nr:bifunctional phosphopantothenoylcysteine decarboxylase/phosphopantothenate--cysteine ligase CoaBC [Chromatiales bacterium]
MTEAIPVKILLGVTGGVAAYKAPDLVRRLRERGAEVRVVMTAGAEQFVTPRTFQAVSGSPVRTSLWDEGAEAAMGHIELARWADKIVIAPASADFLARLTAGMADDLLATLCLAAEAPLYVAPAMNRVMWSNSATRDNIVRLGERGVTLLGPALGDQACGETGPGRMLEPEHIATLVLQSGEGQLAGMSFVITAGPTREPIDPVRYITNRSSGKMGFALAEAAAAAGARVRLVSGPVGLATPPGVERFDVQTAEDMYAAVHEQLSGSDIFIGAAAVSDYRPEQSAEHKIKKTEERLELKLTRAPDTLRSVAALAAPARPFTVGFAAETEHLEAHAVQKLESKRLDMIVANLVGEGRAFDCDENEVVVFWSDGKREIGLASKRELARELVELIATRARAASRSDAA